MTHSRLTETMGEIQIYMSPSGGTDKRAKGAMRDISSHRSIYSVVTHLGPLDTHDVETHTLDVVELASETFIRPTAIAPKNAHRSRLVISPLASRSSSPGLAMKRTGRDEIPDLHGRDVTRLGRRSIVQSEPIGQDLVDGFAPHRIIVVRLSETGEGDDGQGSERRD